MRFLKKCFRFVFRLTAWCCSLVFGVIFVFLAGYWLGWKATPVQASLVPATAVSTPAGSASPGTIPATPGHPPGARAETAQERMVRLARLLVTSTDQRSASIQVAVEISSYTLDEVYDSLAALQTAPSSSTFNGLRVSLVARMTSLSPYAALDYAKQTISAGNPVGGEYLMTVFSRWSFSDPVTALSNWRDFMAMNPVEKDSLEMMRYNYYGLPDIIGKLGQKDLALALKEAATLTPEQQPSAFLSLSTLAAKEGPRNQILAAVAALPPGQAHNEALAMTVEMWARSGGQRDAAVQWLDSAQLSRAEVMRVEDRIADSGDLSRRETADWLVSRAQSPDERSRRLERAVDNWAREDPVAAGEWLKAQGLDQNASRAMSIYARVVVADHPALAVEWARRIPDEAVRERTFTEVERRIRFQYPHRTAELLGASR